MLLPNDAIECGLTLLCNRASWPADHARWYAPRLRAVRRNDVHER